MTRSGTKERLESAERYRPGTVDCLFVAEAPPSDESRYFFFEVVPTGDSLYLELSKALFFSLDVARLRSEKPRFLDHLRNRSLWLIDLAEEPVPNRDDKLSYLNDWVGSLVDKCKAIKPRRVILIAGTVYDIAYRPLVEAEVPVVDVRIPFPGSGRQKEFRAALWRAIDRASLSPDPVVLDGNCISYWLDALDHIVAPDKDDIMATQKLSLVRMFYYWPWVLSYTQGIRVEVEQIKDPERLTRHEQWMTIHLRELPPIDAQTVAASQVRLARHGVNEADAGWMAEALANGIPLVITWDQALLNETADLEGIEVVSPHEAWASLSIPGGARSRIAPTPDNPLSQQDWWTV